MLSEQHQSARHGFALIKSLRNAQGRTHWVNRRLLVHILDQLVLCIFCRSTGQGNRHRAPHRVQRDSTGLKFHGGAALKSFQSSSDEASFEFSSLQ